MTPSGGEIIGADDGRSVFNLAPAADVVSRCEGIDFTLIVIRGEACDATDFSE